MTGAQRRKSGYTFVLITATCTAAVLLIAAWLSVAAHGSDALLIATQIAVLCCGLAIPCASIACIFDPARRVALRVLVVSVTIFAVWVCVWPIGERIRSRGFERIAGRGDAIIDAIETYIADTGSPPSRLEELVPEYLSAIPDTGVAAYPNYWYSYNEPKGHWMVIVPVSSFVDWGSVVFWSSQEYPESWDRFGAWAGVPPD